MKNGGEFNMYLKTQRTVSVKGKIENLILFYEVKQLSLIQSESRGKASCFSSRRSRFYRVRKTPNGNKI